MIIKQWYDFAFYLSWKKVVKMLKANLICALKGKRWRWQNVRKEMKAKKGLCKFNTRLKGFIDIGSAYNLFAQPSDDCLHSRLKWQTLNLDRKNVVKWWRKVQLKTNLIWCFCHRALSHSLKLKRKATWDKQINFCKVITHKLWCLSCSVIEFQTIREIAFKNFFSCFSTWKFNYSEFNFLENFPHHFTSPRRFSPEIKRGIEKLFQEKLLHRDFSSFLLRQLQLYSNAVNWIWHDL